MKLFTAFSLLLLSSAVLLAQDSTNVTPLQFSVKSVTPIGPVLSASPTAQELADLFISIGQDLSSERAVSIVTEKGDKAVPGLSRLLSRNSIGRSDRPANSPPDDTLVTAPYKMHAMAALVAIGTPEALDVVLSMTSSKDKKELVGLALNEVANKYYANAARSRRAPSTKLITALFRMADDQTMIGCLQKSTGQIAQEGIMRWLGIDFGEQQYDDARLKAGKGRGKKLTVAEYRQYWFQQNASKLVWDEEAGRFKAPK